MFISQVIQLRSIVVAYSRNRPDLLIKSNLLEKLLNIAPLNDVFVFEFLPSYLCSLTDEGLDHLGDYFVKIKIILPDINAGDCEKESVGRTIYLEYSDSLRWWQSSHRRTHETDHIIPFDGVGNELIRKSCFSQLWNIKTTQQFSGIEEHRKSPMGEAFSGIKREDLMAQGCLEDGGLLE